MVATRSRRVSDHVGAHLGVTKAEAAAGHLLSDQPVGRGATIVRVVAPPLALEWALRLAEIGFIPGERVMVTARGRPGGDPLAVRVGASTFALRRAEAACIQIAPDGAAP
jgi:ferrous iron transport protein A